MQQIPHFFQSKTSHRAILLILAALSGLCSSSAVYARSVHELSSPQISLPSQTMTIAQVTPMRGRWKLRFSTVGIVHESTLVMNGYSGWMKTRYFSPATKRTETVEQVMMIRPSAQGLLIVGYNPVYAGTNIRHPSYLPDALLFQINPDGTEILMTCDTTGRGQCSAVEIESF